MTKDYWNDRYRNNQTGWDLGAVSPPIMEFADDIEDRDLKILIPGVGNAYEAEYLFKSGFKNVFLCDIAEIPLNSFSRRNPEFPEQQMLHQDFFEIENSFDLILEQTFFCALPVSKRNAYAHKTELAPILLLETDDSGNPVTDPNDPSKYLTKLISNSSGIVQPTLGIVIEFKVKK